MGLLSSTSTLISLLTLGTPLRTREGLLELAKRYDALACRIEDMADHTPLMGLIPTNEHCLPMVPATPELEKH
jgi:hypothetical protein